MARSNSNTTESHAFTLIELLVVIGIIGILIALSLAAGNKVVNGAKGASTGETIRVLQQSVEAYIDQRDEVPPPYAETDPTTGILIALSDAPPISTNDPYYAGGDRQGYSATVLKNIEATPNGLSWFIFQIEQKDKVSGATQIIDTINSKVRSTQLLDAGKVEIPIGKFLDGTEVGPVSTGWKTVRVHDAWGRPIRFVHPRLDGEYGSSSPSKRDRANPMPLQPPSTQSEIPSLLGFPPAPYNNIMAPPYPGTSDNTKLARSGVEDESGLAQPWTGNSDGGSCIGNRPYFYSEGQDGKAFTAADNIYSTKPRLPKSVN